MGGKLLQSVNCYLIMIMIKRSVNGNICPNQGHANSLGIIYFMLNQVLERKRESFLVYFIRSICNKKDVLNRYEGDFLYFLLSCQDTYTL